MSEDAIESVAFREDSENGLGEVTFRAGHFLHQVSDSMEEGPPSFKRYDMLSKILLVGDSGSGKTTLLNR